MYCILLSIWITAHMHTSLKIFNPRHLHLGASASNCYTCICCCANCYSYTAVQLLYILMYAQSSSIAIASSLWCELSDQVQCVYCTELPKIFIIVLHNTYRNSSLQQLLHSPGSEHCTALAVQTTIDYSRATVMHNTVALEVVIYVSAVTPVAVTYHVSLQQFVPHHVSR